MTIRKQAISGAKWTTIATITLALSSLLKISILTRFLDPTDFGLMALITFVLGFMDLFMDMGITSAILHKQSITRTEYASLYWLNIGLSSILYLIIILLSPFIASFYSEIELTNLIPLSGLVIVFSAIGRQYKTVFQKRLEFKKMAIIDICSVFIAFIAAVFFAYKGYGVYALVYSSILQYGFNNFLYFTLGIKNTPILFHYNYLETKPFLKIGAYQVGGHVINYFNRDLDVLIIGKFFGADILGGYSLAKQLVRRPISIIDPIINKVAVSILPRYQSNNTLLLNYFNKLIGGLGIVNAIVYGCIAIMAPLVILILYGDSYVYIAPLVSLFTIIVYFRSIAGLVGILSITKGRTDVEFYWNVIIAIVMPIVVFLGVISKRIEVILTLLAMAQILLIFPLWYMFYHKQLKMSFWGFIKRVFIPSILTGVIYIIYYFSGLESVVFQIITSVLLCLTLTFYLIKSDKSVLNLLKSNKYVIPFFKNR